MEIITNEINIGAAAPFEILHISDTHLTLADDRNDGRKRRLAEKRREGFPEAEKVLSEAAAISERENLPVMNTGDIIDFVSYANLDKVREYTEGRDFFTCAGNHEFSLYVGEAWEDDAYKAQSFDLVQGFFANSIDFDSRVINGVNFVAIDNSYYLIKKKQLEMLKNEVNKGFPTVLMVHVPLFCRDLYDHMICSLGNTDAALMGVPEELLASYNDHRYRQQKPDSDTLEAFEYITGEPGIKLILAGHLHFDYETAVGSGLPQIVTGKTTIRKIRFR